MIHWRILIGVIINTLMWIAGVAILIIGGTKVLNALTAAGYINIVGYTVAGSLALWVLFYTISDSYRKAVIKSNCKTRAELAQQMFHLTQKRLEEDDVLMEADYKGSEDVRYNK
jgi:hypothetical protein